MGIADIRRKYKVPAKRGMPAAMQDSWGVITGASRENDHLLLRFPGMSRSSPVHPTWEMTYELPDGSHQEFGVRLTSAEKVCRREGHCVFTLGAVSCTMCRRDRQGRRLKLR